MTNHRTINFSPYATNVLDYCDKPGLCTPNGTPIKVTLGYRGFVITIGEQEFQTLDNTTASYILNTHEAGVTQ